MNTPNDDKHLADQFVLGLLDAADQSTAEHRVARDADFADLVAAASRRFAPLDDTAIPVPLAPGAWMRLEDRLNTPAPQAAPMPSTVRLETTAANLNRWPSRLLAGLAAALLVAVGLSSLLQDWPFAVGGKDAIAVAVLLDPKGAPFALIEDFGGGDAALTTLVDYAVPEGKSLQAWTKWSEKTGPVSLGVLSAFFGTSLGADGLPQPVSGQLYEITLEQEGGSATGRPTGPVLGVGRAGTPG